MRKIESIVLMGVVSFLAACGGGGGGSAMSDNSSSSSVMSSSSSSSSSSAQATGSHNAGMDCLASGCHSSGGDGTEFKVAGTVYRSGGAAQTNAEVRLYIHNTNTPATQPMQTDASGNFWTTSNVDGISDGSGTLVTGVDVEVEGPGGIRTMPGLVTNGSCNSCHGNSNGNIVAN